MADSNEWLVLGGILLVGILGIVFLRQQPASSSEICPSGDPVCAKLVTILPEYYTTTAD